ncbi:MAG TPA: hypothetical protein VGR11_11245 [Solirubrobacteraceae bacterium]|nr:hypothetical protein [Solirubrobacteraceae bacterium]
MIRQSPRQATVAVVAAIAVGFAGCGGDDAPSNEEFVAQANAICERHHARISEKASKVLAGGNLPSPREFGELARGTIIPEYSAQIEELRALEPSEEKEEQFRAWLDDSTQLKNRLAANPAMIQNPQALEPVNAEAERIGLAEECQVGPT